MTFSNRVLSVTQDEILPKAYDQVLSDNFATFRFIGAGKKWSGSSLKRPVKLTTNTNGGSFSGLDTHSTAAVETRQLMEYDLRAYEMPVAIPGLDLLVNRTDAQIINLMRIETESSANDALDQIGGYFYLDGTGNSSKNFLGLDALVDDGTSATTIGGLSRSTYSVLQGTRTASGGTMTLNKIGTLIDSVSGGSAVRQRPTMLVSNETVWSLYESLLTPTVRSNYDTNGYPMVTRSSKGAIAAGQFKGGQGFSSLIFRGIPWVADEKSTSQTLWAVNENYLEWYGARDKDMSVPEFDNDIEGVYSELPSKNSGLQFSGFMKPINQYGVVGHIYLFGNLVTFQPRRHGRLTGITQV